MSSKITTESNLSKEADNPTSSAFFQPGFRISKLDIFVLAVGTGATSFVAAFDGTLAFALAFVVAHFFLFCNILRMTRPFELVWALSFVGLASSSIIVSIPTWPQTFFASIVCTIVVTLVQFQQPSYHGIFWQSINPNLPTWWQANRKASS